MTDKEYIELYKSGMSLRQIAENYKVSRNRIAKILKENEVHIQYSNETARKYTVNHDYFNVIDTEHKAYWLGFIYADGYITGKVKHGSQKFGVSLAEVDKNHLIKLKNDLESTYELHNITGSGFNKEGKFNRLVVTSQPLVDALKKHGVVESKTKILTFPTFMPEDLKRHFIRGYLDGDGTIFKTNIYAISFIGTESMMLGIIDCFNKPMSIQRDRSMYTVKFRGKKLVQTLLEYLYTDATIYLDRKYEKYIEIKNM